MAEIFKIKNSSTESNLQTILIIQHTNDELEKVLQ